MHAFPKTFSMHRATIAVPTHHNDGSPAPEHLSNVEETLSGFGLHGYTRYPARGYWNGAGEDVLIIEVYVELPPGTAHEWATRLAANVREDMPDQDAIQVTIEPTATLLIEG